MGFLKRLLGGQPKGGQDADANALVYYVKGRKCGAITRVRVDRYNDLSLDDDGESYVVRKGIVDNVCYGTVDIELRFDPSRNETGRQATGGEFVSREEWEAWQASRG